MKEKNKKKDREKWSGAGGLSVRYLPTLSSESRKKMLTDTEYQFRQVWAGKVWRSHAFPKLTPIRLIADKLQITEAPLKKALLRRQHSVAQYDIIRH